MAGLKTVATAKTRRGRRALFHQAELIRGMRGRGCLLSECERAYFQVLANRQHSGYAIRPDDNHGPAPRSRISKEFHCGVY